MLLMKDPYYLIAYINIYTPLTKSGMHAKQNMASFA